MSFSNAFLEALSFIPVIFTTTIRITGKLKHTYFFFKIRVWAFWTIIGFIFLKHILTTSAQCPKLPLSLGVRVKNSSPKKTVKVENEFDMNSTGVDNRGDFCVAGIVGLLWR